MHSVHLLTSTYPRRLAHYNLYQYQNHNTMSNVSSSRAVEALSRIPLSTASFGALCCLTFTFQILANPDVSHYTLNAQRVIFHQEYYRIITCAFFHGSIFHIAMNMMSYMTLGKSLEKRVGTFFMYLTVLWSVLLTSLLHISMSLAISIVTQDSSLLHRNSLGFSAVLFHLLVLESKCHDPAIASSRLVFGVIHVPSKFYPWVLLFTLQFLMPNISFLGHLSGILCGILQSKSKNYMIPSIDVFHRCEQSHYLRNITSLQNYVHVPFETDHFILNTFFPNPRDGGGDTTIINRNRCLATVYTCVCDAYLKITKRNSSSCCMSSQRNNDNTDKDHEAIRMQQQPFLSSYTTSSNDERIPKESEMV